MTSTLIDGHAHFHRIFSLPAFLRAAELNIRTAKSALALSGRSVGVLLLAQLDAKPPLGDVTRALPSVKQSWDVTEPDSTSLVFENNDTVLVLVAGRQIVTQEKLELLCLCCDELVPHGLPLSQSMERAIANDAVPVIPWGFGKWYFERGRILNAFLNSSFGERYLMGDNGCRMTWLRSSFLEQARRKGIATLAGSDPLPIKAHQNRGLSFGSVVPGAIDLDAPTAWLRSKLMGLDSDRTFGRCRSLSEFVADQVRVRMAKFE